MTFRWENPSAFFYLWMVVVLAILFVVLWRIREKSLKKSLNSRLLPFLVASRSLPKRRLKMILELLVVIFAVIALARPQFGQNTQKIKSQGVELVIAIDVSNSMMAEDIKPNRLEHAKNEINRLLDQLSGDKVGLIAFAGSAVTLAPLTNDFSSVRLFLETLGPNSVTTQGTDFKGAVDQALGAVKRGGLDAEDGVRVSKVLLIVTDGETTKSDALESARKAADEGLRIFTLGLGTKAGAPIPDRDEAGNLRGYKKDVKHQVVLSSANEEELTKLAQAGGGAYYHADFSGQAISGIRRDLDKMDKAEFESDLMTNYDEKFQILILMALLFAFIELLLSERKRDAKLWRGRFEAGVLAFLFLTPLAEANSVGATLKNREALKKLEQEKVREANQLLAEAAVAHPNEGGLFYNLGQTYEANDEKDKALQSYQMAARFSEDPELTFQARFNSGRLLGEQKQVEAAIQEYQAALDIKPDSMETKSNIELLLKNGGGGGGGDKKQEEKKDGDGEDKEKPDSDDQKQPPQPKQQEQKKPQPRPFQSQELSQQDVKKILDELRRQEEQVRAKFNEKKTREQPVEKDW